MFIHGANGLAARDIDSGAVKWRIFMKLGYGWRAVSGGGLVFAPQWQEEKPAWVGFDAATGKYGDLMETGIIDPTKVVRLALENAVSAAGVLLLTEATMTEVPEPKTEAAPAMDAA